MDLAGWQLAVALEWEKTMAAEHTPGARDKRSGIGFSWLFLLITLFILLIVNAVLLFILLNRVRSDDIERLPIMVTSVTRPMQPTIPSTVAVGEAATFTLPKPTLAPIQTLQPTEAISELPVLVVSPTPFNLTATPLPMTETPLPTATLIPPTETPLPTATSYTVKTASISPEEEGWHGEYYANSSLAGSPVLEQYNADLAFNWGYSGPAVGVPADRFSARWERTLYLDAGVYQFYAHGDDGVRVWVDNLLLMNEWHGAVDVTYTGQVTLRSGNHNVKVEYYENEGTAEIQFWWEGPGSYSEWRGEYWSNRNLSGDSTLVRNDEVIDFNWGRNSPDDELPRNEFSVRWTRLVDFDDGTYRFHATVDDGLRLYIDNEMVIYDWRDGSVRDISATRTLTSGTHYMRVEYYQYKGVATIHLWWDRE